MGFKKILAIEPAKNLAKIANKSKIKTINCFLDKKNLRKIKKNADIILASNVFAHSDKLKEMAECMIKLLKNKGTILCDDLNLSQALGVRQAIKEFSDENKIKYEIVHERFAKFNFN